MSELEKKFEPTEIYKDKLEDVRKLPQETEELKAEKKEKAKEFRMEVMLDNARLMANLTAQLEWNPWSTTEDLQNSTNKTAEFLAHPEVVKNFINDLHTVKTRVESVLDKAGNRDFAAYQVYKQLIKNNSLEYEPRGKIKVDMSYPLAVMLFVEDSKDFNMIDSRENIGGFYRASATFSFGEQELNIPVIVVKGEFRSVNKAPAIKRVEDHEKGHAEHERLISSLNASGRKVVWFKAQPKAKTVTSLKELANTKQPEKTKEFEQILNYALEKAKDEILAELKASSYEAGKYMANLKKRGGVYDYFSGLGIAPDTQMYRDLWAAYEKKLDDAFKSLNFLLIIYKLWSLDYRFEVIRWVMVQIPLKDWAQQINKSGFKKEAEMLYALMIERSQMLISNGKISPALEEMIKQINADQWRSFIPIIKKYQNTFSNINLKK